MKVGFIGTGSMGSLLIEAFLHAGTLSPDQIMVHNRTKAKAARLANLYPGLLPADSNMQLVDACDVTFLCVKPMEFKSVLDDIRLALNEEKQLVSITSPILLRHLEDYLPPCKIAKIIPSITNYERSGASLCVFGSAMTDADQNRLLELIRTISEPIEIEENYTRVMSDLSSCGPAFLAFFLDRMLEAAVEETGIPYESAAHLVGEMVLGTGKLLTTGGFSPKSLQHRVSVPGGITAEAISMMDDVTQGMFNRLFTTTHAKYYDDIVKIDKMLYGQRVDELTN